MQVNVAIRLRISGVDSAIVQVVKSELPMTLPKISFPSSIEIYSGKLKSVSGFIGNEVNEIEIKSVSSTYPLNVDFDLNFKNFIPPAGKDSTKVDTVLKKGVTFEKTYKFFFTPYRKTNKLMASQAALNITRLYLSNGLRRT